MIKPLSRLGLGCWSFGTDRYWGQQSHKDSVRTIHAALRGGITHFDTAQVYASGRSEQITGQQLKKVRENVTIATKSFYHPPDIFKKGIETSLKRLCTDYIDIFYLHWPSPGKDFRPLIEILEKYRKRGTIRAIGVSNFSPGEIKTLLNAGTIDFVQTGHSLLFRRPEKTLIPFCTRQDIGVVTYGALAQGVLTDKFISLYNSNGAGFNDNDPRNKLIFLDKKSKSHVMTFLKEAALIARRLNLTLSQLALGWELSMPWAESVLAGARNRAQIEENLKSPGTNSLGVLSEASRALPASIVKKLTNLSSTLDQHIPEGDNIFNHNPR